MAFTLEKDKFILEAYYRSGRLVEGEYQYSLRQCAEEFRIQFPEAVVGNENLNRHIRRIVKRFTETGRVGKGKSSGRPVKLTQKTLEDINELLQECPEQSIRQLSRKTGLSTGTCHKAVNAMNKLETQNPPQEQTEETVQIKQEPCSLDMEEEVDSEEKLSDVELMRFGESLITKLRGLSKVDGVKLMLEIQEMITKTRLDYLQSLEEDQPELVEVHTFSDL